MNDTGATLRPRTRRPWARAQTALDAVALLAAMVGVAGLLLEHGFHYPPAGLTLGWLQFAQVLAAGAMIAERVGRIFVSADRKAFLRSHIPDALLPVGSLLIGAITAHGWQIAVLASQFYIVGFVLARGLGLYLLTISSGVHPSRVLVGGFLFAILFGTGLLLLPRAAPLGRQPLYLDDALFTATSATCVTGLIVLDTGSDFSRLGQWVILGLIQLGGLGIMTFGSLFVMLGGRSLGIRHTAATGEALGEISSGRIARMVKFIVLSTLVIEAAGMALLWPLWRGQPDALFRALFHSVSAFCNAGFALQTDSFVGLRDRWQVLTVMPALIILGGLGFPVLMELVGAFPRAARYWLRRHRRIAGVPRPRLSLHSRIVLTTSLVLLLAGTLYLWLGEGPPRAAGVGAQEHHVGPEATQRLTDWQAMKRWDRLGQAWFQSASARTAGFNTVTISELSSGGKLVLMALMVVGGSPASTAGGMKTVAFAVLVLTVSSTLRGRPSVEVHGRRLIEPLIRRAITLAVLFLALVCATTLMLAVVQGPSSRFIDVLFESVSACGTVGTSLGETARLTLGGKGVIIAAMFAGRLGPLTLLLTVAGRGRPARYQYPTENLVIG